MAIKTTVGIAHSTAGLDNPADYTRAQLDLRAAEGPGTRFPNHASIPESSIAASIAQFAALS